MTGISGSGSYQMESDDTTLNAEYVFEVPFDKTSIIIFAIFIAVFFVVGFFANLVTLTVILLSKKLRNVFNSFIVSLCFSDLFSTLISLINLYRRTWGFEDFQLPNFFCVLYWGGDVWTSFVTAQHIAIFAILRLLSIWKPFLFKKITIQQANIIIMLIWMFGFCCGFVPMSLWRGARIINRTADSPTTRWPSCTQFHESLPQYKIYSYYGYAIFIYIPLVIVVIVSAIIGFMMIRRKVPAQKQSTKRTRKERQAMLQLALIVGSFMLGYLPFTIFEFYTINTTDKTPPVLRRLWWMGTGQYILLRFSECLNPFFYNLGSTKMRKATLTFAKRWFCCFNCGPCQKFTNVTDFESSSTPSNTAYNNHVL